MGDKVPHQQVTYDQIQGAIPCKYRGPLDIKTKHEPATACCIAKDIVVSCSFNCTLLNKKITDGNHCWACTQRAP